MKLKVLGESDIRAACPHRLFNSASSETGGCSLIASRIGSPNTVSHETCSKCLAAGVDTKRAELHRANEARAILKSIAPLIQHLQPEDRDRARQAARDLGIEKDLELQVNYKGQSEGQAERRGPCPAARMRERIMCAFKERYPEFLAQCDKPRFVLIGNGKSAATGGMGRLIDSFENVLRFNKFTTEWHQDHVGFKTTHWSTFMGGVPRPKYVFDIPNILIPWPIPPVQRTKTNLKYLDHLRKHCPNVTVAEPSYWKECAEWVRERSGNPGAKPSSGMVVAHYLLSTTEASIAIHGFDWFSDRKHHHYNDSREPLGPGAAHKGSTEFEWLLEQAQEGKIVPLEVLRPLMKEAE